MKKILLATTMLVGTAGFAAAEITMSGSAVMGVGDTGTETVSKMETYLTFSASGESDSGISFGFDQTIATYDTDSASIENDGTSVYISGAFGKLSMGSVAEADEVATLSDIGGIGGLGVDNLAEAFSGDSAGRQSHDVNYSYSAGGVSVAASAHIGAAGEGDAYAVGGKYSFGDAYVGVGYNDDNTSANAGTVTSLYAGGTAGALSVKAMYSSWDADSGDEADAWGIHTSYTSGALTLSAAYADNDQATDAAFGVGAAYDLGGGASVVGGVADNGAETVWEAGVSLSF